MTQCTNKNKIRDFELREFVTCMLFFNFLTSWIFPNSYSSVAYGKNTVSNTGICLRKQEIER